MNERQFQFEWDETKADANLHKHGVSFELASSVFGDPRLLTVPDREHGETDERWFSIGWARNGAMLSIVYVWTESEAIAKSGSSQPEEQPNPRCANIRTLYE